MKDKSIKILIEQGTQAAIDFLHTQDDRVEAAKSFNAVGRHAYNEMKDLEACILICQAGIAYASFQAKSSDDQEKTNALNIQVKSISYNLASFTWPGWNEEWIGEIPAETLRLGLDAAQTNLHMVKEMDLGDLPVSRGHWIVAAQQIAAGQYDEAKSNFKLAIEFAEKAKADGDILLSHGFVHVTDLLKDPENKESKSSLEGIKAEIAKIEYGEFYIKQLDDALSIFGNN